MLRSAWLLALVVGLAVLSAAASPSNPRELRALKAALKKQQRAKELRTAAAKSSAAGSGEYVPDSGPWSAENEPSCEQLREMWRQSKRHSRAAEATNEIPQYADPFARAGSPYGAQWTALVGAEPTLRPRAERRPVVYGRPLRHPPSDDAERSPLETLRREALQEHDASAFRLAGADPSTGVVLSSEDERSPFPKSPAKGQFNNLRDFVRQEGAAAGVAGGYERLRDAVRQEKASRSRDWTETDVGRVVMSPSELGGGGGGKHGASLFSSMQSDAPYEGQAHGRRPANRLAAFFGTQKGSSVRGGGSGKMLIDDAEPSVDGRIQKAYQLRDPPRHRIGQQQQQAPQHRLPARTRFTTAIDPEDQGVVRGYVVGRNSNPFYSRPSRRSSPTAVEDYEQTETCGLESDGVCRRNADCRCLARLFGSQSALLAAAKCKRARCLATKGTKAISIRDDGLLAADDAAEQPAAGQEDGAGETALSRSDVSQLIRALRLDDGGDDDDASDDSTTDESEKSI